MTRYSVPTNSAYARGWRSLIAPRMTRTPRHSHRIRRLKDELDLYGSRVCTPLGRQVLAPSSRPIVSDDCPRKGEPRHGNHDRPDQGQDALHPQDPIVTSHLSAVKSLRRFPIRELLTGRTTDGHGSAVSR
jgi:hypothetical protein